MILLAHTLLEFLFFYFFSFSIFKVLALPFLLLVSSMSISPILNFLHCDSLLHWVQICLGCTGCSEGVYWRFEESCQLVLNCGMPKGLVENFMKSFHKAQGLGRMVPQESLSTEGRDAHHPAFFFMCIFNTGLWISLLESWLESSHPFQLLKTVIFFQGAWGEFLLWHSGNEHD